MNTNNEIVKAAYYRQKYADQRLSADARIAYIDSLIEFHPADETKLLENKIELCYDNGYYAEAIETFNHLSQRSNEIDESRMCRYMLIKAGALSNIGHYKLLSEFVPKMIAFPKADSLRYYEAAAYALISNLSMTLNKSSKTGAMEGMLVAESLDRGEAIQKVESILREAYDKRMTDYVISKIKKSLISMRADSAEMAGNPNVRLKYQEELLGLPLTDNERVGVKLNIGMTYLNMGKLDIALDIFKGLLSEPPSHRNHGMALVNALHILNSSGRYAEAIELYNQHKVAASYVDPSIGLPYLLANRGMAYAGLGDYKDAYELMERAMAMTDSLRISLDYREGDFVIMLREKDVTLQHLKKNLSKFRVVIWIVAGLLLVAVVAFVGIWRRWRHANKTCTRLTMEAEENREKNVNTTADFLRLARVNESMEQIDSIYREKRVSDREKLERIGKQLDNVSLLENSWEVFRHNFEGAHSGFFRILKDNHPDLTQSEMRMCAYVVMQLSSKEIAALTGRTVRSVESMRYRIQKKLDVSGKDSLVEYLLSTTRAGK